MEANPSMLWNLVMALIVQVLCVEFLQAYDHVLVNLRVVE